MSTAVLAQEQDNQANVVRELGINTTFLAFQLFNFNDNALVPSNNVPFLSYKRIENKNAFRTALGFNYNKGPNFQRINSLFLTNRIGYERQIPILNHFQINTGFDATFRLDRLASRTDLISSTAGLGLSYFLGFEVKITDRLSFLTETNFFYEHVFSRVRETRTFPVTSLDISFINRVSFGPPTTLYFLIKF